MKTVGRLGSYITKGVYTVSGPFHPFGGAVDIIVVEQPDGSFKSSPWYVRFGKFQGVLKANEKVVKISVNGVEANFHMYLDQRGEAYFLKEVEREEGELVLSPPSSSDERDAGTMKTLRPVKSERYNLDGALSNSGNQDEDSNRKIVAISPSRRSKIMGIVFGRRSASTKDGSFQELDDGTGIARIGSLERAEIAANLLELQWSTNLATSKSKKGSRFPPFSPKKLNENLQVDTSVHVSSMGIVGNGVLPGDVKPGNLEMEKQQKLDSGSLEEDSLVEASMVASLSITEQTNASILAEVVVEARGDKIPEISSNSNDTSLQNADDHENGDIPRALNHGVQRPGPGEVREGGPLEEQHTCGQLDIALSGSGISVGDNGFNEVQSFLHWETSQGLLGLDGLKEQTHETIYLAGAEQEEVIAHSLSETMHVTSQILPGDTVNEQVVNVGLMGDDGLDLEMIKAVSNSDTPAATFTAGLPLVEAAESVSIYNTSNYGNSSNQTEKEEKFGEFQPGFVPGGIEPLLYLSPERASSAPMSETSEEEQLLFGDLDEFKPSKVLHGSESPNSMDIESEEANGPCFPYSELVSSSEKTVKNKAFGLETKGVLSPIDVGEIPSVSGSEAGRLAESMPNISSHIGSLDTGLFRSTSHSLDIGSKSMEWALCQDELGSSNVETGIDNQSVLEHSIGEDKFNLDNGSSGVVASAIGDPLKEIVASGGSWRVWPFSQKRSGSRRTSPSALNDTRSSEPENVSDCTFADQLSSGLENDSSSAIGMNADSNLMKPKVTKKMARVLTPTSEQLASLNLQEGRNVVTFTFSTPMLGKQEVDARIYLWKWNTRIVISDVDGTITKSDVLGQFMPLVGVDWSQTGVANLFSAIKENGYQLLFLSARAISQAYHTRRFLFSLKQDGKSLPDGPVVISPDGLFPSLFREVIRRAPHEFKIACLEDIKALFPPDCQPFYAGFGNRDTDEISYIKVGIPKGKIFIINPKGEIAVHRRVDRKSYHSLHDLVHGMFPSTVSFEQEDYNSWNYWKLPSPLIDI